MTLAINHRRIIRSLRIVVLTGCLFQTARVQAANVTAVSPEANAQRVGPSSDIVVTFDGAIPVAAVNGANFTVNGAQSGRVGGILTGGGTTTVIFNPTRDFHAGEVVTVTLTAGLGLPLSGYTWQFTIASAAVVPAFTTIPPVSTTATTAYEVYPIDMNGDGDVDMISVGLGGVSWYENNGSQTLVPHSVSTGAASPTSLRAADLDNDGDVDMLVTSHDDSKIIWLENNGSQVFTPRTLASGEQATFLYTEDMDADGDVDVLAACEAYGKIILYKNDGAGVFTSNTIATNVMNVNELYAADVDSDGDMDILASSFNTFSLNDGKILWYENLQSLVFPGYTVSTGVRYARGVYATDMDRDGDMDVVSVSNSNGQILWHENNGSQTFIDHIAVALTNSSSGAWSVHAADIDGDGDMDLVGYDFRNFQVLWHENDGAQNFANHIVSTGADGVMVAYAADIDGDGDMDIMTASLNDNRIAWYPNNGTPIPNRAPTFTKGSDIEVTEDAPLQSFTAWATSISAGAPSESNQLLTFVVSNDNTALFSTQPTLDATGTLTFKSADNAWGIATVTVLLEDNGGTANGGIDQSVPTTFTITIHPVNDAPWVDAVADITLVAGSPSVDLILTGLHPGPGEDSQHLTVTASSDAPFELADPSVTLHGDGTATLLLAPAPGASGTITVTVVIRDDGGTARGGDDDTVITFTVTIEPESGPGVRHAVFLPTLFSPNGDGANDALCVRTADVADIRFSIYSPDGHEVFQTTDITEATERGWNGRYHGRDMPAGTYTWTLQGHFTDGNPLTFGKHGYGQVVLLR
ncbi:FG-GAP-like repeat-containing protein [Parachryseolinea silvisoli]|uniref:FG-GAP-like repeat-containing protein n=1 Tax=Parachryseolinea silvisoli TaxID=2873601 RepID=UPI002265A2F7|nr:FG-GAP-like repeat-containing protein [Parachryseolinea silvisoli]MCD9019824.1 FG-GAP-like repeat-containing protein [Parachryseolinea silvisoli]